MRNFIRKNRVPHLCNNFPVGLLDAEKTGQKLSHACVPIEKTMTELSHACVPRRVNKRVMSYSPGQKASRTRKQSRLS
jgi:hypothetical protein